MKKTILGLLMLGLLTLTACTKESGNKNIVKSETTAEDPSVDKAHRSGSNTYTYRGLEGYRAKVIFTNLDGENTLTIQANNSRFQLDKKSEDEGEVHYEINGISAISKGDSLIVTQDGNVIPLAWDN